MPTAPGQSQISSAIESCASRSATTCIFRQPSLVSHLDSHSLCATHDHCCRPGLHMHSVCDASGVAASKN